jgi:hypothetical protein
MRRQTAAIVLVAVVLFTAGAIALEYYSRPPGPTVTFTRQTVIEIAEIPLCTDTYATAFATYTTTAVTTLAPHDLPQGYVATTITTSTVSTLYTDWKGPLTTC